MAKHVVKCRICGKHFDTSEGVEGVDWTMPVRNYYYHKSCYENWRRNKDDVALEANDGIWFESLREYLAKDLKIAIDWKKMNSQWKNFLKQGKTAKGIYFAIKYHYEYGNGDPKKAQGGIGIVSSIYNDSCAYWYDRTQREKDICDKIEKQVRERQEQKKVVLTDKKAKKNRTAPRFNLADVEDDE